MELMEDKLKVQTDKFLQAVVRLGEALKQEKSEFVRDSVIQRFEFCFELWWKMMQTKLRVEGRQDTDSPRQVILVAGQIGEIKEVEIWLDFLEARNLSSHTYNEDTAEYVYGKADLFWQMNK